MSIQANLRSPAGPSHYNEVKVEEEASIEVMDPTVITDIGVNSSDSDIKAEGMDNDMTATFAMVVIAMIAMASNSVLSRAGIYTYGMDPLAFSGVRLGSGALGLVALVALRAKEFPELTRNHVIPPLFLIAYLLPFTYAYTTLPSGVGALIMFGVVQVVMFLGSAYKGKQPVFRQWLGMCVAMCGLCWLLWPRENEVASIDIRGGVLMVFAGVGWGSFSLLGSTSEAPLTDMAISFAIASPLSLLFIIISLVKGEGWSLYGVLLGIVSGVIASGLGYALWYRVIPLIATTTAAVSQLTVPIIAMVLGAVFLNEVITMDVIIASAIVLGGVALSVERRTSRS